MKLALAKIVLDDEWYEVVQSEKGLVYFGRQQDHHELLKFFPWAEISDTADLDPVIEAQLQAYFAGEPVTFTFAFDFVGTPFQQNVWQALTQIPYGQTTTYSDLALRIQRPTAVRAVANAVGRNPMMIVVPCHRVLGKNGRLTGYRGGLATKRRLLQLEGIPFKE